jgi:hypothetical protein
MSAGSVAADPELPGAELLLEPDVAALLAPAVGGAGGCLHAARATQVRYQAGRRMAVRYAADVEWADGSRRTETLGALVQAEPLPEGLAVVRGDDGIEVGVWRYPHDPFLPGLPHAAYPEGARQLLATLGVRAERVTVEPLVYRPSSRAVVRIRAEGLLLYVKLVRPHRTEALVALHERAGERVRVPRVLGSSMPLGLVALEPLGGAPLTRSLVDGGALPDPEALLALLDALAEVALPAGTPEGVPAVASHARLLTTALPSAASEIEDLAAMALDLGEPATRPVHGDFYEAQVMVDATGEVQGVLDIDGMRWGAPHDDPATLLGHLVALAHVHPARAEAIDAYRRRLERIVDADPALVRRAALGVLLGLATTSFRRQEDDWPGRTQGWLDRCRSYAAAALGPGGGA